MKQRHRLRESVAQGHQSVLVGVPFVDVHDNAVCGVVGVWMHHVKYPVGKRVAHSARG